MSKKYRTKRAVPAKNQDEVKQASAPAAEVASQITPFAATAGIVFALILAVLLGLRPVIDGYVYPFWNYHFGAVCFVLFAVWTILALLRMIPANIPRESVLLVGFVLWAAFGLTYTVQYDATFRGVLLWAGYACAFVVAASALNTRTALTIVLGGFMVTAFCEAVYSLFHVQYILPFVRMQVLTDASLTEQYFGVRARTDDLNHRLASNRAFGTFLFPNALGAYMAMAIPVALAGALVSWRRLTARLADQSFDRWAMEASGRNRGWQLGVGLGMAVVTAMILFSVAYLFIYVIEDTDVLNRSWFRSPLVYWFSIAVIPLVSAGAVLYAMRVYGFAGFFTLFRAVAYPLATLVLIATLYAAFTRGAILALVGSGLIVAWLTLKPPRWIQPSTQALSMLAILGLALTSLVIGVNASTAVAQEPPAQVSSPLDVAGSSPTMSEALSGDTFGLRIGYWQVGLRIWLNHFFTGVGLGNFGTVYPGYQFIGASDVKTAHNDFLQVLSETGPIGFLLFAGFWVCFFLSGARALQTITDPQQRLMAIGLYAGLLAFILHSTVDFNFVNPSLSLPALGLAGAFHAMVRPYRREASGPSRHTLHLALLIPVLALLAILAGAGTRAYYTDLQLRRLGHATQFDNQPLRAANYILAEAVPENARPDADFNIAVNEAMRLVPDRPTLESFGMIVAPTGNRSQPWRRVSANEQLGGEMLVIIRNFDDAHRAARQAGTHRAQLLAAVDSAYPHRADVAAHLYQWYFLLLNTTQDEAERRVFVDESVYWAREAVARSPRQSWYHSFLGNALWEKGKQLQERERIQMLEESLSHYLRAAELLPMETAVRHDYARAMHAFGEVLQSMGRPARGEYFISMAQAEHHHAEQVQRQINAWRWGTPAGGESES